MTGLAISPTQNHHVIALASLVNQVETGGELNVHSSHNCDSQPLRFHCLLDLERSKIQSLRLRVAERTTELSCKMSVVVKVTSIGNLAERLACVQQRSLRRKGQKEPRRTRRPRVSVSCPWMKEIQDAGFQVSGVSPKISLNSRGHLQCVQRPPSSHLCKNAPSVSRIGEEHVAQGGMIKAEAMAAADNSFSISFPFSNVPVSPLKVACLRLARQPSDATFWRDGRSVFRAA